MTHGVLLLQLATITAAARICGAVARRLGQPEVIGEMTAGVLLGPVVLGRLAPGLHAHLFAKATLAPLSSLATVGVVLFMFLVGVELRTPDGVRTQLTSAGRVGVLATFLPLLLGLCISPWLYPRLAPPGLGFWSFGLFVSAALSVTAFPVMARILKDRGLTQTRLGRLALSSAALSDVFAWIILAFVLSVAGTGEGYAGLLKTVAGLGAVAAIVFVPGKRFFARLLEGEMPEGRPTARAMAALLVGLLASAAATDALGLHAVFGAFLFGASLPRNDRLYDALRDRFESIALLLLLPIVFALAGLATTPDAFTGTGAGALALLLTAAIVGKIVGGAAGARLSGYGWRDSVATGALMNARGLMELVVMKVGLECGLIGPELFTMLLVMTLSTTVMTGPLLSLVGGKWASAAPPAEAEDAGRRA